MKWFLSRRTPPARRILLIESGPRELGERAIERLRSVFGENVPIDAVCCVSEPPSGAVESWNVSEHPGFRARLRLIGALRAQRPPIAAILAGPDPIMAPWRWVAALALPSKILIVNENADFFWLDWAHWRAALAFWQHRSGLGGESALRSLTRMATFPFALAYLLVYGGWVHTMRFSRGVLGLKHRAVRW